MLSGSGRRAVALVVAALFVSAPGAASADPAPAKTTSVPEAPAPPRVSRGRAVLLSILLPGLGQQMSGHTGRAKLFYGAETAIWSSSVAFKVVSNMRFQDVDEYARIRGHADPSDHSDDYFQLLSDYPSSDDYNIAIRDEARTIYPDDRAAQLAYIDAHSIQGVHAWNWPDYATQRKFQLIRHDALSARRRALLILGWAVVNRAISAIEAARSYPEDTTPPSGFSRKDAPGTPGAEASAGRDSASPYTLQAGLTTQMGRPAAGIGITRTF